VDALTAFRVAALTFMIVMYALEPEVTASSSGSLSGALSRASTDSYLVRDRSGSSRRSGAAWLGDVTSGHEPLPREA